MIYPTITKLLFLSSQKFKLKRTELVINSQRKGLKLSFVAYLMMRGQKLKRRKFLTLHPNLAFYF